MKRILSNSKLRQNGFTDFEAEILRYVAANDIHEGSFHGVPGHPRYETSKCNVYVNVNSDTYISVNRDDKKNGTKVLAIDPRNYISSREVKESASVVKEDVPTTTTPAGGSNALAALSGLLQQQQQVGYNQAKTEYEAKLNELKKQVKKASENGTGTTINITIEGKTTTSKTEKAMDAQFAKIVKLVAGGEYVYLYGPAGSGKNVIAEEVAKALHLDFFYQNTILTKFDITGYKNANGEYEETEFYKAWTKGGLILFDELDNSQAEAIVALNAALANGYYTFPTLGKVAKHKDFRCMAAANTNGQGATEDYCGRYKMDESSRDRFAFVRIDYNSKVEKSIVGEHTDILDFVYELRAICKEREISLIIGYRAINKLAKYYDEEDIMFILNAYIFRGLNHDTFIEIQGLLPESDNKYIKAVKACEYNA